MQKPLVKICSLLILSTSASYAFDQISISEDEALFSVMDNTIPIVTSKYIGWDKGWKWALPKITAEHSSNSNQNYTGSSFDGTFKNLSIDFTGKNVLNPTSSQMTWKYTWNKKLEIPEAIGAGIEFSLDLKSSSFNTKSQDPIFLPNNSGWSWRTPDGLIKVQFKPALAKIHFERGNKNKIRAFFFEDIKKGVQSSKMIVTSSKKNVPFVAPTSALYDSDNVNTWYKDVLPAKTSPIDLSYLNKSNMPVGKRGFIQAVGDQLMFEDGTPVKFWGANVQAQALFKTTDDNIRLHAKRIAQLGFNLVRIHHHDSDWVKPNVFSDPTNNTRRLNKDSLKKLDLWITALKANGVHIWLDLHVGRVVTKNDNITDFNEVAGQKKSPFIKGFSYFNDSIRKQMQVFNRAYLTHVNTFSKLAYKNDPAIVALTITNENDITHHYGNMVLGNKGVPKHNARFMQSVKAFSNRHGLPLKETQKTWEAGPSKIYLNDQEHQFNKSMIRHLRQFGVKAPLVTTSSWGKMPIFSLPALSEGNIISTHSYGKAEELNYNPRFKSNFLSWIASAQLANKPLAVTEWNIEPFPAADRFTVPLYVASIANLQQWDALMLYGYSQLHLNSSNKGSNYSTFNDPSLMGLMPAAALLYRENHVSAAKKTYTLSPSRNDFFYKTQSPETSKTLRTLLEISRLNIKIPQTKELPWLEPNKAAKDSIIIRDFQKDFIPKDQNFVESDTRELKRNWVQGTHTINTQKSQVASGWIGGKELRLKHVKFALQTKKATVAVQSLDQKNINNSKKIFITAIARSQPIDSTDKLPFLSEPVIGEIVVNAPVGLKLYPINRAGKSGTKIATQYINGTYFINLTENANTHWYLLKN